MPDTNPDGTKQVTPPTRSAFDPPSEPIKAGAVQKDTGDKDTGDSEKTKPMQVNEHEESIVNGLRGLHRQGQGKMFNKPSDDEESKMDPAAAATSQGVASAPGNATDY